MYSRILGLTTLALVLAYGTVGAFAQNQMTPQPDQQQIETHPMGQEGAGTMGGGMMRNNGMMGRGMMGPPFMMRMMFALTPSCSSPYRAPL